MGVFKPHPEEAALRNTPRLKAGVAPQGEDLPCDAVAPVSVLPVRPREVGQQLVAALHACFEGGFCGLLACPHRLELFVDHVAYLHEIADTQTL